MKRWMKRMSAVALSTVLLCSGFGTSEAMAQEEDFRGVWISTVYSADYPSTQNNIAAQKEEYTQKLNQLQELGINAVVVQVRPKGDAFYESDLNPWSAVLTGEQGKDPGYDPMKFMIEEAHARGMEFHAWLNPYRITTSGTDLAELSADNMARKNPNWILTYNDAMYFNPEKDEVKQYICDTVEEIVLNYDVDAIHFDDYFYPTNYPLSEGEDRDGAEANARREHVNNMIERVSKTIEKANSNVAFGISPMGVWKNATSDANGSQTKGSEGYYTVFGDAKLWVEKGWIDYITPQIYWEKGNAYADYETLVKWWSNVTKNTDVNLYIGQGIYKDAVAKEAIAQQDINENYAVDGSIYFSLRDLLNDREGCATALKAYYATKGSTEPETPTEPKTPETPETPITTQPPKIENKTAYASTFTVMVNDAPLTVEVYVIDDYTYFKLRNIAAAVNDTDKRFETVWDEAGGAIHLMVGESYTGSGINFGRAGQNSVATTSTAKLYLGGVAQNTSAFTINDYTYYKLRDIAKILDMGVTWDEATATIGIDTRVGY